MRRKKKERKQKTRWKYLRRVRWRGRRAAKIREREAKAGLPGYRKRWVSLSLLPFFFFFSSHPVHPFFSPNFRSTTATHTSLNLLKLGVKCATLVMLQPLAEVVVHVGKSKALGVRSGRGRQWNWKQSWHEEKLISHNSEWVFLLFHVLFKVYALFSSL